MAENKNIAEEFSPTPVSDSVKEKLRDVANENGGAYEPDPALNGAVGFTHFDSNSSEDNLVTILLTKENMDSFPSQALVRIKSIEDKRIYIGSVVSGPFAEPDGLKADSSILVATTVQGKILLPRYHGRAYVQIVGEEVEGRVIPPRYRPRPNSPVFSLTAAETSSILKVGGDIKVGLVMGQEDIEVGIPSEKKSVLPRHTGIIGTTGGGKSTTVGGLVYQFQKANIATIIIDVEGEYTEIDQPTTDPNMLTALKKRDLKADGVKDLTIYHLVGRETSREADGGDIQPFSLRFSDLSPYAIAEILDMTEAQVDRFFKAYEAAQTLLKALKLYTKEEELELMEYDELDTGYPKITLDFLIDVANLILQKVDDSSDGMPPMTPAIKKGLAEAKRVIDKVQTNNRISWLATLGRLWKMRRLNIFDNPKAKPIEYKDLLKAGKVSIIDLSDTDSPEINNLAIAQILRGVQRSQEDAVHEAASKKSAPTPVNVIIEEAHEFLSSERIKQMPVLFQQVAKIAKRGRKRWLGLTFVTQLPQHLPNEVLALINNFILHKISDSGVVDRLRKSISGLDKNQWSTVPGLASGQAVVSITSMARPLMVSIHPTPCKLRFID
jgi:uncharacterized protein